MCLFQSVLFVEGLLVVFAARLAGNEEKLTNSRLAKLPGEHVSAPAGGGTVE